MYHKFLEHLKSLYPVSLPLSLNLHNTKFLPPSHNLTSTTLRATCTYLTNPEECIIDIATASRTDYTICALIAHEYRHASYRDKGIPSTRDPKEEWDAIKFGTMEAKRYFKLHNLPMEGNSLE